jgi:hypothetical protein
MLLVREIFSVLLSSLDLSEPFEPQAYNSFLLCISSGLNFLCFHKHTWAYFLPQYSLHLLDCLNYPPPTVWLVLAPPSPSGLRRIAD